MPEDIPEDSDLPPPETETPKNGGVSPHNKQSPKEWILQGLDGLVVLFTDPTRAWAGFKKIVLNMKGGFIVLLLVVVAIGTHYVDSFFGSSAQLQRQTTSSSSNSPSQQIGSGGTGTQNNDFSSKIFNGNSVNENHGVINNYYITQYVAQVTNIIATASLSSEKSYLVNLMMLYADNVAHTNYVAAFQNASDAIQIIEQPDFVIDNPAKDAAVRSVIYWAAAASLDQTEKNSQMAYEYAQKSANYVTNTYTLSEVAITAFNLSAKLGARGDYARALELNQQAINIYESDPDWLNKYMPNNTIPIWYRNCAWLAGRMGLIKKAETYAYKAAEMQPTNQESLKFLGTILDGQGYNVCGFAYKSNEFKVFIFDTNWEIKEWSNNAP